MVGVLVLTNYAQLLLYISYEANLRKLLNMKESENFRGKISPPNMRGPTPIIVDLHMRFINHTISKLIYDLHALIYDYDL